jgi:hypothetical protein
MSAFSVHLQPQCSWSAPVSCDEMRTAMKQQRSGIIPWINWEYGSYSNSAGLYKKDGTLDYCAIKVQLSICCLLWRKQPAGARSSDDCVNHFATFSLL